MNRYPEYKESGVEWIGEIPSYWQTGTIKYLTRNLDGKRIPLSGEVRAGQKQIYPYYGANGVIDYVEDYIFEGEHILIGEDGAPFFDKTKEVSLLASGKFWVNNHCHILKNIGTSEARFIVYCLNSVDYFEYITGSTRDKLTQADLNRIKIPIPNHQEQKQIANFLDRKTERIDELIYIKERQIGLLQEQRAALINHAVTKGLDPNVEMKPSGVEWIGEIPKHWEVRKNKRIFHERDDRSGTGEEELLTVSHITGVSPRAEKKNVSMFLAETLEGYKHCSVGNLVINTMWAWMGALGVSSFEGIVSPSYNVYQLKSSEYVPKYYDYLYRTPNHIKEIIRWSKGIWTSRWRLYPDAFFSMFAITPPFSEQAQIANFLDRKTEQIDELVAIEQRKIELLKEYRQTLISEAVTGKIDVRNEV
ncbi:MAG: restriction endonuclease subunit S [Candidatus Poribacteria bacterium]|nr:restriction endonuclease subunit S [Candidatus Poribacteria bacterium]